MNGQAKIDFEKWFFKYYNKDKTSVAMFNHEVMFNDFQEIVKQAYIISWFDSVGIYISINYLSIYSDLQKAKGFQSLVCYKNLSTMFREVKTRQEATKKALEKAVELYNLKFKVDE